jgi:K(+)-stimulated pyrophosphate-energized sodium pump
MSLTIEEIMLWTVIATALGALIYAVLLARQTLKEKTGTGKMLQVWRAISEGANAYLKKQIKSILLIIIVLAVVLYLSSVLVGGPPSIAIGRALAFVMGVAFSGMVGFIGMNMAVKGNIRVAEAARRNFHDALRIAYRSGTITGMLTDGLGLLGGTAIFMIYFRDAYQSSRRRRRPCRES